MCWFLEETAPSCRRRGSFGIGRLFRAACLNSSLYRLGIYIAVGISAGNLVRAGGVQLGLHKVENVTLSLGEGKLGGLASMEFHQSAILRRI